MHRAAVVLRRAVAASAAAPQSKVRPGKLCTFQQHERWLSFAASASDGGIHADEDSPPPAHPPQTHSGLHAEGEALWTCSNRLSAYQINHSEIVQELLQSRSEVACDAALLSCLESFGADEACLLLEGMMRVALRPTGRAAQATLSAAAATRSSKEMAELAMRLRQAGASAENARRSGSMVAQAVAAATAPPAAASVPGDEVVGAGEGGLPAHIEARAAELLAQAQEDTGSLPDRAAVTELLVAAATAGAAPAATLALFERFAERGWEPEAASVAVAAEA
ncbi:unnamed protein product, partial [Phaeothamnion confervicola]